MPNPSSRLEAALASPRDFRQLLSAQEHGSLAERVEEALMLGRRDHLRDFSLRLEALLAMQIDRLPKGAIGELTSDVLSPMRLAYEVGALSFAHLVTSQAAERRAPDDIEELAQSDPLAPYLKALLVGERTNSELSELVNEAQETVSRKLRKLRAAGIADFRREGRNSANFLTPLGRSLVGGESVLAQESSDIEQESRLIHRALMQRLMHPLPDFLRTQPVMKAEPLHAQLPGAAHGG